MVTTRSMRGTSKKTDSNFTGNNVIEDDYEWTKGGWTVVEWTVDDDAFTIFMKNDYLKKYYKNRPPPINGVDLAQKGEKSSDPISAEIKMDRKMLSTFNGDETAPFFGFLGAAAALVFSRIGAAYGTTKIGVGVASMGVMRTELVRKSIVPVVMGHGWFIRYL
ncbi:hypothetical protein OROMI_012271 [Orobanche minor]